MSALAGNVRLREEYGRGVHAIDDGDLVDSGAVLERLRATFRSPGYRPPVLPAAAVELVRLTQRADVSFKEVQAVLERDALITGRVLQVAQSPAYYSGGGALTLHQALARLGLRTMTELFLEVSMNMRIFRAPGYEAPMDSLRRHTTAVAHMTRLVCRHAAFAEDYAFLCGLLHDCGIAAALMVLGETARGVAPPAFDDVFPAVLEVHEEVGAMLCRSWKLPADVELVVRHHHSCTVAGRVHPLTAAINVAEALAAQAGFGLQDDASPEIPEAAAQALRIDERTLKLIRADAAPVLARIT